MLKPNLRGTSCNVAEIPQIVSTPKLTDSGQCLNTPLLDTLAQLDTKLKKRAKSKYFTQFVVKHLVDLKSGLTQHYWNAYHCNSELIQTGDKVTSRYCNSRICNVCNRIRTAKMINGYLPEVEKMGQPQFVTLTIPNVEEANLKATIQAMQEAFQKMINRFKKNKRIYSGIRKLEITYNAIEDTYHPHYHIIANNKEIASAIKQMWLGYYPSAEHYLQHIRDVDKNSMQELFKYTTKVVVKASNGVQAIHIKAIDTIMHATWRRRIIQPFGKIKKQVSEDVDELQADTYPGIPSYSFMEWQWERKDWINKYGELLTGYEPSNALAQLEVR